MSYDVGSQFSFGEETMINSKQNSQASQLRDLVNREAIYRERFCLCQVRLDTADFDDKGVCLTLSVTQGICAWPPDWHSTQLRASWEMLGVLDGMVWTTSVPWWLHFNPEVVSAVVTIAAELPTSLSDGARYRGIQQRLAERRLSV